MKILYICLCGLYLPDWGYQENLLAKYHVKAGHEVVVITSNWSYDHNSNFVPYKGEMVSYSDGVKIIRLKIKGNKTFSAKLKRFCDLYETIESEVPDMIFLHSPQLLDADVICKYISQHHNVKLIVDNHNDFMNSAKNILSKYILHGIIWKRSVQMLDKYADVFYGVTPARVDFLVKMYGIEKSRIKLLPFGADDEMVEKSISEGCREKIRGKYGIKNDDVLLLTGGKIDHNKPETLTLMEAVTLLNNEKVKLLVYGSVIPELENRFKKLQQHESIIFVGWLKTDEIYSYQEAADLIVFPGLHSVLWEQSVGAGKACLFRRIEGFTHIDLGGNCDFFDGLTVSDMKIKISSLIGSDRIEYMRRIACEEGRKKFSYRQIANDLISNS